MNYIERRRWARDAVRNWKATEGENTGNIVKIPTVEKKKPCEYCSGKGYRRQGKHAKLRCLNCTISGEVLQSSNGR